MTINYVIFQNANSVLVNLVCKHCGCNADRYITDSKKELNTIKCPNCGKTENDK